MEEEKEKKHFQEAQDDVHTHQHTTHTKTLSKAIIARIVLIFLKVRGGQVVF